ncbi:hypothetical protein FVB32_01690 [Flagellimonas hymeniacidonis]|uniref:Uncharacterized protein n=1 Tax=Flagellimonas hymeniacidonis TaxID=2603628 RepID=A0A5C8V569_9FLAO|nr:hypothetical protein [Flagellimonas hymeniacidonis]TXN37025.1 hypothetical protein FVB32_01690 [Flagellimonas hymeniacidonis]
MKRFKKALRLLGLFVLVVFASIGVGLNGGVPLPNATRKKDTIELIMESDESEEEDAEEIDLKQ